MEIIHPDIQTYAERHSTPEPDLLVELFDEAAQKLEHLDMFSGPVVGRLLNLLIKIGGATRVLEIGTFAGYSALLMAEALPEGGRLITCEINENYAAIARKYFEKSAHGDKIELMMGEALDSIKRLEEGLDFVFLDADKINYPRYYDAVLPKMVPGGLLVIDNVFWSGGVLNPDEKEAEAIDRLNKRIADDDRVEQVMLTERDGLTLVRKR
ncbi:MAG: O-methyltransferase [Balneolaceae bacterium]|nr:O-methyltransferase [Balneolaceae bacterium]